MCVAFWFNPSWNDDYGPEKTAARRISQRTEDVLWCFQAWQLGAVQGTHADFQGNPLST